MIRQPAAQAPGPPSRTAVILISLVTLAGLGLRLDALGVVGLWWDEFVTLGRAAWPVADLLRSLAFEGPSDVSLDSSPPLLHLLVHAGLTLGSGDVWVKLPSVAAGTLTIPVVWLLGRRLFSEQTGLAGAAICAFALFPVHYSREARPYALYLLCALTGLLFLLRAMDSGRRRDWAGFIAANCAMFYASYLASATFAAEGLIVLGRGLALRRAGQGREAGRLLVSAGLSAVVVLAAYAPWLPAHLFQVRTIHGQSEPGARFASAGFASVLRSFSASQYQGGLPWPALLGGLGVLGLGFHLIRGRGRSLAILAVWALGNLAMAAVLPTAIHVSVRYLVNLFFLYAFALAGGLEALISLAGRLTRRPGRAVAAGQGAVLAVVLGTAACLPAFAVWDIYVKRDSPSIKAVLADLAATHGNVEALRFYRPRHFKIISQWYLGDALDTGQKPFSRRYSRYFFLSPAEEADRIALPEALAVRRTFWADIAKAGRVNRAPLPLTAPYSIDFSDMAVLSDAFDLDNLTPDLAYDTLALTDCRRPGRAVFTFAVPPGVQAGPTVARLGLALRRGKAGLPEGRATIAAGPDPAAATTLATVTAADFAPGAGELALAVSLPPPDPTTGRVSLVLTLEAGQVDGFLEFSSLDLTPPAVVTPADAPPAWAQSAAAIAANTPVVPGLDGGPALGGDSLYGFADSPRPDLGLGGPEALAEYLRTYPDDRPVYSLADEDGRVRARYFDPLLRRSLTRIEATTGPEGDAAAGAGRLPTRLVPGFGQAVTARGLWAGGTLAGQTVRIGDAAVTLPLTAPAGSLLALGDDGRGRLRFAPAFDRPLPDILAETALSHALAAVPGEPAVTCSGDAPCFLTYAVTAPAGQTPIIGFTATWYPMVLTDGTGQNQVTAQWSVDGRTYHDLDRLGSVGNFFYYAGGTMRQAGAVRLPRPADRLYLRFVLSGAGARLYSSGDTLLTLETALAGTGFAGLPLGAGPVAAASGGPAASLLPTLAPPALDVGLRETR